MRRKVIKIVFGVAAAFAIGATCVISFLYYRNDPNRPTRRINQAASAKYSNRYFPVPVDYKSKDVLSVKRRALAGDQKQSGVLIGYYDNCLVRYEVGETKGLPTESECKAELDFWIHIAAINGTSGAASREFNNLMNSRNCRSVYRARFWLLKIPRHTSEEPWMSEDRRLQKIERDCGW